MAKRQTPSPSIYKGDSFQMYYLEEIRNPTYTRRIVKFPFLRDRDAANIDYLSDRRTYYGQVPKDPPREGGINSRYSIRDGFEYNAGPNRIVNPTQRYELPDNLVATTSGLRELDEGETHPDFLDPPIGNFDYITSSVSTLGMGSQELFIAKNLSKEQRFDGLEDIYYPVHGTSSRIPRLHYFNHMSPSYQAPVYPETRTPSAEVPTRFGKF